MTDISELFSEAAVEISNLDSPQNPVVARLRKASKDRHTYLTIEQAIAILDRSERGRAVGRQLHEFLADRAGALDMDGKVAVLSLLEESFINRPGSVFEALGRFADQKGGAA